MSWYVPTSKWAKAIQARTFLFKTMATLGMTAGLIALVYCANILSRNYFRGVTHSSLELACTGLAVFGLLWGIVAYTLYRKFAWIARSIRESDGLVCPRCRVLLTPDGEHASCPRCMRNMPCEEVRRYWTEALLSPWQAGETLQRILRLRPGGKLTIGDRFVMSMTPRQPRWQSVLVWWLPWLLLPLLAGWLLKFSFNPLQFVLPMLPIIAVTIGMTLVLRGAVSRSGKSPSCAECGYRKDHESYLCPECGSDWSSSGGLLYGNTAPQRKYVAFGVVCILAASFVSWIPWYPYVPTSVVTAAACYAQSPQAWKELKTRKLSQEQVTATASWLLDARENTGKLQHSAGDWLGKQISAGRLGEELVARTYSGAIKTRLEADDRVKAGQPFRVEIAGDFIHFLGVGHKNVLLVEGFYLERLSGVDKPDKPTKPAERERPLGRRPIPFHASFFGFGGGSPPAVEMQADQPGEYLIRVRFWHAGGTNFPVTKWLADGTPQFGPGAIWHEKVELTRPITVD